MTEIKLVHLEVEKRVLASHGFTPSHFTACVVAKGGSNYGDTVTDRCGHQHLTRQEAEGCLPALVPTPHAVGLQDGDIHVLAPKGGIWT